MERIADYFSFFLEAIKDNAPHHRTVSSFPHHKHCRDGATVASSINNIFEIFNSLDDELKDKI
jgi:hypothetical protein